MATVLIMRPSPERPALDEPAALAEADQTELQAGTAETVEERPIYRHSVVPGGVYTAEELATAMLQDPLVADHYRGLIADAVQRQTVAHERPVYVSYRRDGRVYWTRNPVVLRQGETILTDGHTQIRARCGNCISDVPMMPVADREPDPDELDRLVDGNPPVTAGSAAAGPAAVFPQRPAAAPASTLLPGASDPSLPGASDPSSLAPDAPPLVAGTPIPDYSGPVSPRGGGVPPGMVDPAWPQPSPGDAPAPPEFDRTESFPIPDEGDTAPPSGDPADMPGLFDPEAPGSSPFPEGPSTGTWPPPFGDPPSLGLIPDTGSEPSGPGYHPTYDGGFPVEPQNPVPVPEPGTLLLVGGGAVTALFRTLRSRLK